LEAIADCRDLDHLEWKAGDVGITSGAQQDRIALSRNNLVQSILNFVIQTIFGQNHDNWNLFINERKRSMLQFTS